jgi:hypothetical protein
MAFLVCLAGSEVTTAGERASCGVEVDGDRAIGDGSALDGTAGYSRPESGGGIRTSAAEADLARLRRYLYVNVKSPINSWNSSIVIYCKLKLKNPRI